MQDMDKPKPKPIAGKIFNPGMSLYEFFLNMPFTGI